MTAWRVAVALALAASSPILALADEVIRIPRENGAVHREFRHMLTDVLGRFRSGIGRAELSGTAGAEPCVVNLFTNTDTTFVTVNVGDRTRYTEFYVDHPTETFKSVLFQSVTLSDAGRELKVVMRDMEYSVLVDGDRMTLGTRAGKAKPWVTCSFDLTSARLFEGQTE
jgi:hypothetical protein